jgi:hypothetical protein
MFSEAVAKSGRPMVVSLSPGPISIDKRDEVSRYSQIWRISQDVWDVWNSDKNFPNGVKNQFIYAARWAGVANPGRWPDADCYPSAACVLAQDGASRAIRVSPATNSVRC